MKNKLIILLCFLPFFGMAQDVFFSHNYSSQLIVFSDNANLREKPSLESKITGTVSFGTELKSMYSSIKGVVGGVKGRWIKILYKDKICYIWNGLIATSNFKSQIYLDNSFLIKHSKRNKFEVKVFEKGIYQKTISLSNNSKLKYFGGHSLGKTYNSDNKDIFVFYFGSYDSTISQFYQWDGSDLIKFDNTLKDNSFSNYNNKNSRIIIEKLVNLRKNPSADSVIIKVLGFGYKVNLIKERVKRDTVNNEIGYWSQVSCKNDTGFVWSSYVSMYSFESYKEKSLSFVISESDGWQHKILAIRNNKVVDSYSFDRISNFSGAHSNGNLGLKNVSEIIAVCYSSYSCGQSGGDVLIAWDGMKFKKFFEESGVGDGGLSDGVNLTFPSENNGKKGIVVMGYYGSESINLYSEKGESNYESINRTYLVRNYKYEDSLIEIDSDTKEIEAILVKKLPKYQLQYFEKADLNSDGYLDVILCATEISDRYSENYEHRSNKTILVILLKDKIGNYSVKTSSKKLIVHKDNMPLSKIIAKKGGFTVKIFYSGYYNNENNKKHYELEYKFDKKLNDFVLKKLIDITPPARYGGEWSKKEFNYRKNTVLFKDSYHPFWE